MLYYFEHRLKRGYANLGDDLNPWLLSRVLGQEVLTSPDPLVIGIGTLLSVPFQEEMPAAPRTFVFSSGCGYFERPKPDASWRFFAVRGMHTRQTLGLPDSVVLGDGAMLLPDYSAEILGAGGDARQGDVLFIPHVDSAEPARSAWEATCEDAGVRFMSPAEPLEALVDAITKADRVLTSAMHAAIVADAFGTPWVAVSAPGINEEKWRDWGSALGIEPRFHRIPSMPLISEDKRLERIQRRFKRYLLTKCITRLKRQDPQISDRSSLASAQSNLRFAAEKVRASV